MLKEEVKEPVRVNTRLSRDTHDWLERKAYEMGMNKSALINVAVENYRKESEMTRSMPQLMKKLEEYGWKMQ